MTQVEFGESMLAVNTAVGAFPNKVLLIGGSLLPVFLLGIGIVSIIHFCVLAF